MITQTEGFLVIGGLLYLIALKLGAVNRPGRLEYCCFALIALYWMMGWPL